MAAQRRNNGRGTLHAPTAEITKKYAEALHLYATTTESIKSLARRFGFNDCSFGQFIRRNIPEQHRQHQKLVQQAKKAD